MDWRCSAYKNYNTGENADSDRGREREMKKEPFICPHCKMRTGWICETPFRGTYWYETDEYGEQEFGEYSGHYYEKSMKYICLTCNKTITAAVKAWMERNKKTYGY